MTKPKAISSTARALANKRTTLTAKEARFVVEYLVDGNQTAAARRAGYKGPSAAKTAHEIMQRPVVRAAVQAAREKLAKRTERSVDKVLNDIARISEKAEAAAEFNAALKGQELLGRHLGAFPTKVEGSLTIRRGPADLTDEELAAIAKGQGADA